MPKIIIPTPLRKFTGQTRTFETGHKTLDEAIDHLMSEYPEIRDNMLDENGEIRSYIKIYIGENEVRPGNNGDLRLEDDTEISIVPAIAGG